MKPLWYPSVYFLQDLCKSTKLLILLTYFSFFMVSCFNYLGSSQILNMICKSLQIWPLHAFQPQLPVLDLPASLPYTHSFVPFNSFSFSQTTFRVHPTAFLPQDFFCTIIPKSLLSLQFICHFSRKVFTDFPHLSQGLITSLLFFLSTVFIIRLFLFLRTHGFEPFRKS